MTGEENARNEQARVWGVEAVALFLTLPALGVLSLALWGLRVERKAGRRAVDRDPVGDEVMNEKMPNIQSLPEAEDWIGVLHRRTVQDAERMVIFEARLNVLEAPWWQRRRHRGYLAWLQGQVREHRT